MRLQKIKSLARTRGEKPWVFAMVWLTTIAIFGYHLNENLAYPWFGNPDQDLVFLRDGLRLSQLKAPLYSDHPGLAQMTLGALAHLFYDKGGIALGDKDWQNIYNAHKIINAFAMATILACCCEALGKLIDKLNATVVGLCCALSMGSTSLVYQLRNEFFSAYLFFLGSLIICLLIKERCGQAKNLDIQKPIRVLAPAACAMLYLMALLAKIQVIPLMALFCLGLGLWGISASGYQAKPVLNALKTSTLFSAFCTGPLFLSGVKAGSLTQAWMIILLTLFPIQLACTGFETQEKIRQANVRRSLLAYVTCLTTYTVIVRAFHWETVSWNPWGINKYTFPVTGEAATSTLSLWQRATDGYLLLFERTFDGQLIAISLSIILPVLIAIKAAYAFAKQKDSEKKKINFVESEIVGCYLFICASVMACVASLRWPVDHYLSYQQPILYLVIALMIKPQKPIFFRSLSLYALASATIISIKYPTYSYSTYVKISEPVIHTKSAASDQSPSYNPGLCAPQHAGHEWKGSVVGKACSY